MSRSVIFMINVLFKKIMNKKSYAFVYAYVYVYRNKLFHEPSDSNVMSGSHGENLEMSVYLTPERRCVWCSNQTNIYKYIYINKNV